jgi:hypothetical protein
MRQTKVGDMVMFIEETYSRLTRGKIYKVEQVSYSHRGILRVIDDNVELGGWYLERFVNINAIIERDELCITLVIYFYVLGVTHMLLKAEYTKCLN